MNNGFWSVQLEVVIAESTPRLPEPWPCARSRVVGEAAGPVTFVPFSVGVTATCSFTHCSKFLLYIGRYGHPYFVLSLFSLFTNVFFYTYDPNH